MKRKEIKWRREGRGTMAGRQDGIIFRIFHPWDAPERGHTVSCYDTRGTGREISTAGYREFTWEEAVEFCQKIAAGGIDLEDLQAQFDAEDMAKEREAVRKTTERPSGGPCGAVWTISTPWGGSISWLSRCAGKPSKKPFKVWRYRPWTEKRSF